MNTLEKAALEAKRNLDAADAKKSNKNPKLTWNHDGKTMAEVLGYETQDKLLEVTLETDNDSDLKFAVLMLQHMQSPDGAILGLVIQELVNSDINKPSHIAEMVVNKIHGEEREMIEVTIMVGTSSDPLETLLGVMKGINNDNN